MGSNQSTNNTYPTRHYTDHEIRQNIQRIFVNNNNVDNESPVDSLNWFNMEGGNQNTSISK